MSKILRILILLVAVVFTTYCYNENVVAPRNITNIMHRGSIYGIIGIGAAFVIMAGGIDLSIGSLVGLGGTLFYYFVAYSHTYYFMGKHQLSITTCSLLLLSIFLLIGLIHGILITKLKIQPFIVTLCGMMIYRGTARWLTNDSTLGLNGQHPGLEKVSEYKFHLLSNHANPEDPYLMPITLVYILVIGAISWILLNQTIFGRYILAIGRNEQAARYCGIKTDFYVICTYIISSVLAGFAGVLFALYGGTASPGSHGSSFELYAIAAAVLGGCNLRGGEGTIIGVMLGATLIPVISNMINLLGINNSMEFAVIGGVILLGAIFDQLLHYWSAYFRTSK